MWWTRWRRKGKEKPCPSSGEFSEQSKLEEVTSYIQK